MIIFTKKCKLIKVLAGGDMVKTVVYHMSDRDLEDYFSDLVSHFH